MAHPKRRSPQPKDTRKKGDSGKSRRNHENRRFEEKLNVMYMLNRVQSQSRKAKYASSMFKVTAGLETSVETVTRQGTN